MLLPCDVPFVGVMLLGTKLRLKCSKCAKLSSIFVLTPTPSFVPQIWDKLLFTFCLLDVRMCLLGTTGFKSGSVSILRVKVKYKP